jgi:EF-P beta-lysylation protein EpmB
MLVKAAWQTSLSNLVTDPKELLSLLKLDPVLLEAANAASRAFPLKVPRGYVARMRVGDLHDPLLKQVLPLGAELEVMNGYETDPLKETESNPVPGLLHKYHGRVLVTLTSACAVHCRYCFRRHFPYAENNPGTAGWEKIMVYLREHPEVNEVILSGGDPLAVSDKLLALFTEKLSEIKHIKRLRIHSRLPVVLPERVTDELIAWLQQMPFDVALVIHANHAQEIDDDVKWALKKLRDAEVMLLNQTVLLRGINDDVSILMELSERLFAVGVLPYYLHVLDKVQGAQHFDLPLDLARELHAKLTSQLSGYLVPRLVVELPGRTSKVAL